MNGLTKWLNDSLEPLSEKTISGNDELLSNLFHLMCDNHNIRFEMLLLINSSGLIISTFFEADQNENINFTGKTVNVDIFDNAPFEFIRITSVLGHTIVSTHHLGARKVLESINSFVESALRIFYKTQKKNKIVMDCLDFLTQAICVFDKNARLLYSNKNFCSLFSIDDREKIIGMHINDIMDKYGITISNNSTSGSRLKMLDVLESGEKELNWEILLESKHSSTPIQLVENDLIPFFDDNNNVAGIIDIFRSYKQEFQRSKKFIALSAKYTFSDIVHTSKVIDEQILLAKKMSNSNNPILVVGESGVGKELFVQSIHNHSKRKNNPFVALNCASLPPELITSELFGYEAGAFTDASKKGQIGKFELANGGTLFLDEISELPYDAQSQLLRVLETWIVLRLGGTNEIPVDVRLIAASNKNLLTMIKKNVFREDLYYRLNSLTLNIPPLRERIDDVIPLSKFFLKQAAKQNSNSTKRLSSDASDVLLHYKWPGNIRELRNVISAATILSEGNTITAETIRQYVMSEDKDVSSLYNESPKERIAFIEQKIHNQYANLLTEAIQLSNGSKRKAAELIGVSTRTFYRMLDKYVKH